MTLRYRFTPKRLYFPPDLQSGIRRQYATRSLRMLGLVLFLSIVGATNGSKHLVAQQNDEEARTIVNSLGSTIFALAWPTASYDSLAFGRLQHEGQSYDVSVVLYGRSAFSSEGSLWLELVVRLREGAVADISMSRHNAQWARPFTTMNLVVSTVSALEDRRNAELLVGTWRDENDNSIYTFASNGRILRGSSVDGVWMVRDGQLSRRYANGNEAKLVLEVVDPNGYRARWSEGGTRWTARRIQVSSADSARMAGTYQRSARAFLEQEEVDSALVYFGTAEFLRNPERLAEVERLLQSSPLGVVSSTAAQRHAYHEHARSILTAVVPNDAWHSIPSASVEEVEDALEMMLPPRQVNVVVTSTPPGLAVRYRVTRSNPRYEHGPYWIITTDTTVIHERAKFQFCYLDSAGESRMTEVRCQTGCTVRLPIPPEWTRPCEDR